MANQARKKSASNDGATQAEDDEAILSELRKKGKKSHYEEGKIARLLSLTVATHRNDLSS